MSAGPSAITPKNSRGGRGARGGRAQAERDEGGEGRRQEPVSGPHAADERAHTLGAAWSAGSPSSTTSCSTSAAPSASSRRSCDLYPQADVFTAVYDEAGTEGWFAHRDVNTSFLQRLRPTAKTFRALLPLYPYAMESLDLSSYDLVISSSSAWAHGVLVDPETVHVCYCHNPFRYAWNAREGTLAKRDPLTRAALARDPQALAPVGLDRRAARRPLRRELRDDRGAGSTATSAATPTVLHPPVDTDRFRARRRRRRRPTSSSPS